MDSTLLTDVDTCNWSELRWSRLHAILHVELSLGENLVMGTMPILSTLPMFLGIFILSDVVFGCIDHSKGSKPWLYSAVILLFITSPLLNFFVATFECQCLRRREWTYTQQNWATSFWDDSRFQIGFWRRLHVPLIFKAGLIYGFAKMVLEYGVMISYEHIMGLPPIRANDPPFGFFEGCSWRLGGHLAYGLDLAVTMRFILVSTCLIWSTLRMTRSHIYLHGIDSDEIAPPKRRYQIDLVKIAAQALWFVALLYAIGGTWISLKLNREADFLLPSWLIVVNHVLLASTMISSRLGFFSSLLTFFFEWRSRKPDREIQL